MGLIRKMSEARNDRRISKQNKRIEKIKISKLLDCELPCQNIITTKYYDGEIIHLLMEYSPQALSMMLQTNVDFDCRFKILTGCDAGWVCNVNRYASKDSPIRFGLVKDKLEISILGLQSEKVPICHNQLNSLEVRYGESIKLKDLILLYKGLNGYDYRINIKNPKDWATLKILSLSEKVFLEETQPIKINLI